MDWLRAVLGALVLSAPLAAGAADVTRLASSFEDDDPFGMFIDTNLQFSFQRTKLLREVLPQVGTDLAQPALFHSKLDLRLNVDIAVGLYRDLELKVGMPLVLMQNEDWGYVSNASDEVRSSIDNNCLMPSGHQIAPGCAATGAGSQPLFPVPGGAYHAGLGNMRFGLAYAIFQQHRDPTKPIWLVGLDYEAPTAPQLNPSVETTFTERTPVGDRVHKYTFYTALSRRMGIAEPYFKAAWTLPVRGPGAYSNCDAPNVSMGQPENCGTALWPRRETGIQAPAVVSMLFGNELTLFEQSSDHSRLVVDVRALGNWVSGGRYYNELSGVMRKLLTSGDYLQFGGQLGATLNLSDIIRVRFSGAYLYSTEHPITAELPGKDRDNDANDNDSLVTPGTVEVSPNFDYRVDFVSRRFLAADGRSFWLEGSAVFVF